MTIASSPRTRHGWLPVLLALCAIGTVHTTSAEDILIEGEYRRSTTEASVAPVKTLVLPFDERFTHEVRFGNLTEEEHLRIAGLPRKGATPIGIHRQPTKAQSTDLAKHISWQLTEQGWAGALTISSAGAKSIRLQLQVESPGPVKLNFFNFNQLGEATVLDTFTVEPQVNANSEYNRLSPSVESQVLWSPSTTGDVIGFNILVPDKLTRDNMSVIIKKLAHRFNHAVPTHQERLIGPEPNDQSACNSEHIVCNSGLINANAENSTAMIEFESSLGSHVCSATLINDTAPGTQYFMITANHCISSDTRAGTVAVHWFYKALTCHARQTDNRYRKTRGGSELVATSSSSDISLIKLNNSPPAGAHYAGISTASSNISIGSILESYDHPKGTWKKYARTVVERIGAVRFCDTNGTNCQVATNRLVARRQVGLHTNGSSGAGMFNGSNLVAVIEGGSSSACGANTFSNAISKVFSEFSPHINPPPVVTQPEASFAKASSSSAESTGTVTLTVNVSPKPKSELNVAFTVSGTASSSDFTTPSNTRVVTIAANSGSADISVAITNDLLHEGNQTVILTLADGTDYNLGSTKTHTLTITDDDAAPSAISLAVSPLTVSENAGKTKVVITATVGGSTRWETLKLVPLSIDGSGLTNVVGFAPVNSFHLVIRAGAGSSTTNFSLSPVSNSVDNNDETVTISGALSGVSIASASVTLTDDDDAPSSVSLAVSPTTISEGSGATTMSVSATVGGSTQWGTSQSIPISIAGSGGSSVVSFTPVSNFNLTIPATENSGSSTFTLSPVEDDVETNDETITVTGTLANVSISSADIILADNDQAENVPVLTIAGGAGVRESEKVSFTISADPLPPSTLTASLLVTSAANSNFLSAQVHGSHVLVIPTTGVATFSASTHEDDVDESNGAVVVTVARGQGYAIGSTNSASVAVLDNDPTTVVLARSNTNDISEDGGSANLSVTLGRNLRTGETITAPLAVTGQHITADDYRLSLNSQSGLNSGVTLDTSTPHSPSQPAVTLTGHDLNTVQIAYLTLTAVDNSGTEPDVETLDVRFGSGSRSVMSNLDLASGIGTAGTNASGTVSIDIVSGSDASDAPPPVVVQPPSTPTPPPPPIPPPTIEQPLDDHGNDQTTATIVGPNSESNGRLDTSEDTDYFQFTLSDQSDLTITTIGTIDTVCTLEDEGSTISRNDDDGVGRNCLIEGTQAIGTYWISVDGYGTATGNYTLSISSKSLDISDRMDSPKTLSVNSSFQSNLGRTNDLDYFSVTPTSAGNLMIFTRGDVDTVGCVYDVNPTPNKALWHCDDDSGKNRNFLHEISVAKTADYLFRVEGFGGATGDYELVIVFSKRDTDDTLFEDSTSVASTADNWIYQIPGVLARGTTHSIRVEISYDSRFVIHTSGDTATDAKLFRSPQLLEPFLSGSGGGGAIPKIDTKVPPGTYYIALEGASENDAGEYQLHLELAPVE